MSEIEKLYENVGIEVPTVRLRIFKDDDGKIYTQPPFTAEKQIELIKWLARKGLLQINYSSHQCYQFNSFRVGGDYKSNLSEALASHCNNLMQDLTEEERKQIADILKG